MEIKKRRDAVDILLYIPNIIGKINNIPQEIQSVVWIIEAVDVDGNIHQKQGTTILMR